MRRRLAFAASTLLLAASAAHAQAPAAAAPARKLPVFTEVTATSGIGRGATSFAWTDCQPASSNAFSRAPVAGSKRQMLNPTRSALREPGRQATSMRPSGSGDGARKKPSPSPVSER